MRPQPVQVVVLPLLGSKDVYYNSSVIQEQPAGVYRAFDVVRPSIPFFEGLLDFLIDSFDLPFGLAGANHEVLGKAANFSHIKQDNIGSLLFACRLDRPARYFYWFQEPSSAV